MAAIANALQRHQRVHFGVIRRCLPGRDVEGQQGEALHPAHMLIPPQRHDVDLLPRLEAQADDVGFVGEQHLALAAHAAVAVVQAIDSGVVLIVRAHRLHDQVWQLAAGAYAFVKQRVGQQVGLEVGAAGAGRPFAAGRAVAQIEATRITQALVKAAETGNGVADQVADAVVVGHQPVPVHRLLAQGRGGDAGNHCRF
ncbi:hypothetical protein D3C80_1224190 [compost metagenome]